MSSLWKHVQLKSSEKGGGGRVRCLFWRAPFSQYEENTLLMFFNADMYKAKDFIFPVYLLFKLTRLFTLYVYQRG